MNTNVKWLLSLACCSTLFVACSQLPFSGKRSAASQSNGGSTFSKDFRLVTDAIRFQDNLSKEDQSPWATVYKHIDGLNVSVVTPVNNDEVICSMNGEIGQTIEDGKQVFITAKSEDEVRCRINPESTQLHTQVNVEYEIKQERVSFETVKQDLQPLYSDIQKELAKDGMSLEVVQMLEKAPGHPLEAYKKSKIISGKQVDLEELDADQTIVYTGSHGQWVIKKGLFKSSNSVTYGPEGLKNKLPRAQQSKLPYPAAQPGGLACGVHGEDGEYKSIAYTGSEIAYRSHSSKAVHICAINLEDIGKSKEGGFTVSYYLIPKGEVVKYVDSALA